MWKFSLVGLAFLMLGFVVLVYKEVIFKKDSSNFYNCESRPLSFWIFIGTEVIVFLSVFSVYFWFFEGESPLSRAQGFSLGGSVCLLTSSL